MINAHAVYLDTSSVVKDSRIILSGVSAALKAESRRIWEKRR